MDDAKPFPLRKLKKAGIAGARRHLFFCLGPDCCQKKKGEALWAFAKKRIAELELPVMRTKAGCLRICCKGPWLVVYPEGVWYPNMTPERLERILQEHVAEDRPVTEWAAAINPLTAEIGRKNEVAFSREEA
jgi:(2Fe-2S) ferredoxin